MAEQTVKAEMASNVAERAASGAAYVASGGVAYMGLSLQEWYGLIGLIFMAGTFAVNFFYRHRTDKHQQEMRDIARANQSKE